jgi:hypothetical protein
MSATAPVTTGVAILVPLNIKNCELPGAERRLNSDPAAFLPGAATVDSK